MKETTIKNIIQYFKENEDTFNSCMEELDGRNGYLGDDRYFEMECLNEFYDSSEPLEILRRAFYGYDEDTSTENRHSEFNPNREYFRYNGYGNLVSTDYKDYSAHLDEYAIEAMSENRSYIDTIDSEEELAALFDELEQAEEEE